MIKLHKREGTGDGRYTEEGNSSSLKYCPVPSAQFPYLVFVKSLLPVNLAEFYSNRHNPDVLPVETNFNEIFASGYPGNSESPTRRLVIGDEAVLIDGSGRHEKYSLEVGGEETSRKPHSYNLPGFKMICDDKM